MHAVWSAQSGLESNRLELSPGKAPYTLNLLAIFVSRLTIAGLILAKELEKAWLNQAAGGFQRRLQGTFSFRNIADR